MKATGEAMAEARAQPECGRGKTPGASIYTRDFWLIFAATFALNCSLNLFLMFPLFIMKLGGGAGSIGAVVATGSLAALLTRPGICSSMVQGAARHATARSSECRNWRAASK